MSDGIYKSPKSPYWQYDFQWKGRRFHGSTGQKSRTAAKRVVEQKRREIADGGGRRSINLDDACGLYFDMVAEGQPSQKTTEYQIQNLIDGLGGDNLLTEIDQSDVARYAAQRRAHVADSSVNREIQLARRIWRHAYKKLRAQVSEIDWSDLLFQEQDERVRELTPDEEDRLFSALRWDYHDFVAFHLLQGPRQSIGLGLRWSDVDFDNKTATGKNKGGGKAHIILTAGMVALIKRQPKVGQFVFTYECQKNRREREAGERYPITKSGLNRVWKNALKAAGIEDFKFHDLRHTAGTRLLRETGNLRLVQKLLNHKSITTTTKYAHVVDDDVRKGLEAVEIGAESRNSPGRNLRNLRRVK